MPVRLNDLINDIRHATLKIGSEEITVGYRPNAITLEHMVELDALTEKQYNRLVDMLCLFIAEWDILDDQDKPIPVLPANLFRMPFHLLMTIFRGIREDMAMGDEEKKVSNGRSSVGSSAAGKLASARNGMASSARHDTWA